MPKIILKGHIEVLQDELLKVMEALEVHKELTKKEDGCIAFEVVQNQQISTHFNVYEEFVNKEAFEKHQVRVKESSWGDISKNVKRVYSIFEG